MTSRRLIPVCLLASALSTLWVGPAWAIEPVMEFTNALRARGYYDSAIQYLEQQQSNQKLPADVRTIIPYEMAVTRMESVASIANPEAQDRELDLALAQLEQFVKDNPNHELAGRANTERARIFLGKARVEVWKAQSPTNEGNKAEYQANARKLVGQAKAIFTTAFNQHEKAWKEFPVYIDQEKDSEKFEARQQAEIRHMRAQLDLAMCTYEEAQTYDRGSKQFKDLLDKGSREFEKIHSTYRSQVVGLYARMWEGKCFEEQDEIGKALGIYTELLGHPGQSPTMRRLQNQVEQFKLICLNHKTRNDYRLVIDEAEDWAKSNGRDLRTSVGLGIRWEQIRAYDLLSERRDIDPKEKDRLLRQALQQARFVNRFPGQYKDVSTFMISRLLGKLGRDAGDPEDFETAFGIARSMTKEIGQLNDEIKAAKTKEERDKLTADKDAHLTETARILNLALRLAGPETPSDQLNNARYLLSYVYYQSRRNYESAILGEFVATHFAKGQGQMGLDAAYLGMAAYVQAYNDAKKADKELHMSFIERVCLLITGSWPESERANDARMNMGQIYSQMERPADAAKYYSEIPKSAPQFSRAQIAAGQAFWNAYLNGSVAAENPPEAQTLATWEKSARQHLQTGIAATEKTVPANAAAPDDLVAAKLSLVQILMNAGEYKSGIDLLNNDPHSVMKAITVEDETKRPKDGIKSSKIAGLAYQLLLRGYVGTQQIEQARATMNQLEKIAGADGGGEAVTEIYRQLGEKIATEMDQLRAAGNQDRLAEVRKSLETFLGDMSARKDQTYGSLIWMAETYYGLAEGARDDDQAKASEYFAKASEAYQRILSQPDFDEKQKLAIQLRLVNAKRSQGEYQQAYDLVSEIVKKQPKVLAIQFEAARVLQDWAASGQGDSYKKYVTAINGTTRTQPDLPIWGWGQISLLLQRNLDAGTGGEDYATRYYQARYNTSKCRHDYAVQLSGDERKKELQSAKFEVETFAAISGDIDEEWWAKFDKLYQDILADLGEPVIPLEKRQSYEVAQSVAETAPQPNAAPKPAATPAPATTPASQSSGGGMLGYLIVGLVFVVGGGASVYYVLKGQKQRTALAYEMTAPTLPIGTSPRPSPRPEGGRRPVAKKPAGKPSAPTGEGTAGQPRQRPARPRPPQAKPGEGGSPGPTAQRPRPKRPPGPPQPPKSE